jgi:hypothetical protein
MPYNIPPGPPLENGGDCGSIPLKRGEIVWVAVRLQRFVFLRHVRKRSQVQSSAR